ncbi:hypothetical protein A1F94_007825 [Pyrenophora tritici-repentis]|nr:hypothetical protein A1F94_007825 [Pyrenophora tritici-repentis]
MASKIPDHWLWLGLGVITFISIRTVSHGLREIITLTTIRQPANLPAQPQPPTPTPTHQEDSIKTSSLLTLSTSHNTDIRLSATKILCNRFTTNETAKRLLINDLNSEDELVVHRAQLAFNLLCDMGAWSREGAFAPMKKTTASRWTVMERVPQGGMVAPGIGIGGAEEERLIRRRRREAVVISEGGGDGDILMDGQDQGHQELTGEEWEESEYEDGDYKDERGQRSQPELQPFPGSERGQRSLTELQSFPESKRASAPKFSGRTAFEGC